MRLGQSRLSPERAQAIAEPVIKQCCDGGYCAGQKSFRFRVGENHSDRTGLLIRLWGVVEVYTAARESRMGISIQLQEKN